MPRPDILKVAGMLVRNRRTLVVRSHKDLTTFMTAGGKPEGNETESQTLVREMSEELGVVIDLSKGVLKLNTYDEPAFNHPSKIVRIETYIVESFEGEPSPHAEIEELKWLNSAESENVDLGSFVKKIISEMVKKGWID